MNVHLLLEGTFIIMVFSWILIKDPFSPLCILCEVFTIATYFATISAKLRGVDISLSTVRYILIQLIISLIVATLLHLAGGRITQEQSFNRIELIKQRYMLILTVVSILTILYIVIFGRSIMASSGGGIAQKLFSFRQSTITGKSVIPTFAIYLTKGIYAFAYFSFFIFIHNREASRSSGLHYKSDRIYLYSAIPLLAVAILSGARAEIIYFICAILSYFSIIRSKRQKKALSFSSIIKIAIYVSVVLFLFYQLSFLFGRGGTSLTSYLAGYFGGSIIAFDRFLSNPVPNSDIWGMELLYSIVHFLQKIGLVEGEIIPIHLDYIYINGSIFTNVYTCFRAYVSDLGIVGSYFAQIVFILFYEKWYLRILKRDNMCGHISMSIVLYGLFSYGIYLTFYSNYLFALVFSVHSLIQILIIMIFKWFTTSARLKIKINTHINL